MTDKTLLATKLGRLVVSENLEHHSVGGDLRELVQEIVLVFISPSVNIVRLNIDLERPVVILDLITVLIELGQLHQGHSASMVSNFIQVLANGVNSTFVAHLSKDVRPTVLEEVERGLSVEGEHGKPVSGSHAVSEELDSMTRCGVQDVRLSLSEFTDSHDTVLGALEHTSVGSVRLGNEFNQSGCADGMGTLYATSRHSVGDCVERQVHVLLEEALEFFSNEELLRSSVFDHISPDHLLLAVGALSLVLSSIEVHDIAKIGALVT